MKQAETKPGKTPRKAADKNGKKRPARKANKKPKKEPVLRCFVAVRFTLENQIKSVMEDLAVLSEDEASKLRIAPPENQHITLKFLGTLPEARLGEVSGVIGQIAARHDAMKLQCRGIGFFKNSIWLGVEADAALSALALELDQAFALLGIAPEQKAYTPHVTIARFGPDARIRLSSLTEKYQADAWGSVAAAKIHLYRSDTLPEGARYTILESFPLNQA